MRHSFLMLLAAAGLAGCAATPPAPTAADADAKQTVASAPEDETKVICHDEVVTGTRLRRERVCATAQEWERRREEAQRAADQMNRRGKQSGGPSGG